MQLLCHKSNNTKNTFKHSFIFNEKFQDVKNLGFEFDKFQDVNKKLKYFNKK